jgi:hypothetical protein
MRGFVFLLLPVVAATGAGTSASADWRENVRAFAEAHLQHTAWGPAHARRDYETTLALARAQGTVVDTDALYAAPRTSTTWAGCRRTLCPASITETAPHSSWTACCGTPDSRWRKWSW